MADDNKLLREEETCKTDNSAPLYTMSTILHIQILLHTVQPEPRTFPRCATRTFPRRATRTFPRRATRTSPRRATRTFPCRAARTFPRRAVRTPKPKTSLRRAIKPKEPKPTPGAEQSRTFQTLVEPRTRNLPCAMPSRTFQTLVVRDWWCRRRAVT